MIAVIDNYDSFTYNLVQYLGELGQEVDVYRNDAVSVEELAHSGAEAIVVSPGPCTPSEAGISKDAIMQLAKLVPVLGVCLGHQCIGEAFGGQVVRAGELVHGKTSLIYHDGQGIYAGLPSPFEATRYHSLVIERSSLPACLEITAQTANGLIMGVRHRELPIDGVQFHPESVLTVVGKDLLRNWLRLAADGRPPAA